MDESYPVLFGERVEQESEPGTEGGIEQVFAKHFGWFFSTTQVAELERITLEQAWDLPVIQYLNDLAYLKMKSKLEAAQLEKLKKKK